MVECLPQDRKVPGSILGWGMRDFLRVRDKLPGVWGRPCGSVAQLAECSHGKREALGSSPGRATIFSSPVTFGGQCGGRLGQRASKGACLVVPPLFRADSGTNLIKQGEGVWGRPCGSVAQLAECSHGKREALGSSPGRATIFSSPVTFPLVLI